MRAEQKKAAYIILLALIGAILILSVPFFFLMGRAMNMSRDGKDLVETIHHYIEANNEIDFDKAIDFEWDEVFIIRPYSNPKTAFENENLKWGGLNTQISTSDTISLIVFLREKEVKAYVDYPRQKGDFQTEGLFERNSSRFVRVQHHQVDWIYLVHESGR